jgi:C4-dicarboxylate-binding protein DctP
MNKCKVGMFIFLGLVLILAPILILSACAEPTSTTPITLRFSCQWPVTMGEVPILKKLETTIPERTNGRVKFELYPSAQLYEQEEAVIACQEGAIEMTIGGYTMAAISPEWSVIGNCPYLFDNIDHLERFINSDTYEEINKKLEDLGIKTIAWCGSRGSSQLVNFKHEISCLEDLTGVKIATAGMPLVLEAGGLLGMQLVTPPVTEMAAALETGIVDGYLSGLSTIAVFPTPGTIYITLVDMFQIPMTLIANLAWWDSLPSDLQQILSDVFYETGLEIKGLNFSLGETLLAKYELDPSAVVTRLTETEKARWTEKLKPLFEELKAESPEIRQLLEVVDSLR